MTVPEDVTTPRRLRIFLLFLLGTFVLTRASLMLRPNADFNIAGYNVHHLFTGFVIATACAIPLALARWSRRATEGFVAGLGIGLSLGLDEVIYLIMTDGSNASYLTAVSWIGGVVFVSLTAIYAAVLSAGRR